jgi:hypothetical protein
MISLFAIVTFVLYYNSRLIAYGMLPDLREQQQRCLVSWFHNWSPTQKSQFLARLEAKISPAASTADVQAVGEELHT